LQRLAVLAEVGRERLPAFTASDTTGAYFAQLKIGVSPDGAPPGEG
jgi:hypothetical protein